MPMNDEPTLILLDTHIWLWLASGVSKAVSPPLRALIEKRVPESAVKISSISVWEIGNLVFKNRISFTIDVKEWVYRAIRETGVGVESIDAEIAIESSSLPKTFHGDPADRIVLATARKIGATLITRDKEIISYCKKQGLPALSL